MDYSPESVAFLDTRISIKDGHLSTSLYRKPTDNFTMLTSPASALNTLKKPSPTDKPSVYTGSPQMRRIATDTSRC